MQAAQQALAEEYERLSQEKETSLAEKIRQAQAEVDQYENLLQSVDNSRLEAQAAIATIRTSRIRERRIIGHSRRNNSADLCARSAVVAKN